MPTDNGALHGISVVDLSRVLAGPFCTQILGDHGADVVKIESPAGDDTRAWGPPFDGETASYFLGLNRNKRSVVLDLSTHEGRQVLEELLAKADVLIDNFKPGTLVRWGLGSETIRSRYPRLVHCCVSGFGETGPLGRLPGYDAVLQAMVGIMSVNGETGGGPLRVGIPVVDLVTGLNAAIGILLALQERSRSGQGQFVDVSLYDCGISVLHPQLANYFLSGRNPARFGNTHPNIVPYDLFQASDGLIFIGAGNEPQFRKLCSYLELDDIVEDPRFRNNAARSVNREVLRAILEERLASRGTQQLARELGDLGVPCGPLQTLDAVVAHPHTQHREMVVDIDGVRTVGTPIKLSRTPATYRYAPPALGEHTAQVLETVKLAAKP